AAAWAVRAFVSVAAADAAAQEAATKKDELRIIVIEGPAPIGQQPPYGFVTMKYGAPQVDTLATEFKDFVEKLGRVFGTTPSTMAGYSVDEIEVRAEVNAQGGWSLIGSATAGATVGVTLKFKKQVTAAAGPSSR